MAGNQWDGERIPGLGWMLAVVVTCAMVIWTITAIYLLSGLL